MASISHRFAREIDKVLMESWDASFRNCTLLSKRQKTRKGRNHSDRHAPGSSSRRLLTDGMILQFAILLRQRSEDRHRGYQRFCRNLRKGIRLPDDGISGIRCM